MRPVHPGEILREDYLVPLDTSANALAKALNAPAPRINDIIVRERRGISADTAMRLARYYGGDIAGNPKIVGCRARGSVGERQQHHSPKRKW